MSLIRRRPATVGFAAFAAMLALSACAPGASDTATSASEAAPQTVTVMAAASLGTAMEEIAAEFARSHPDIVLAPIQYDGSSTLATQIIEGAPADVFAAADERTMADVVDAGLAIAPRTFATNTLTIVVPAGNPAAIDDIGDLADPSRSVVLCAPEVPCGAASSRLLERQRVKLAPVSVEQSVTAALTKVAAGEADAGLVYVTDAAASALVETVPTAGADEVVNTYPIAALTEARSTAAATEFVEFVLSPAGREVLAAHGFGAP